ncbi:MAG TPA: response regulator [Caldilineae bacterium]|nr:response regulator [Caldilineae bacterium]
MIMLARSQGSAGWPYHEDILWLRMSTLRRLIVAGGLVGGLWYCYLTGWLEIVDFQVWSGPIALVAFSLFAYWLTSRGGFLPATCIYIIGMVLGIFLAAWAHADASALLLLALPVGVASMLIGPGAGFLAAGLTIAALEASVALPTIPLIPASMVWKTGIFSFLMAVLLWVAMYPLRMTMHWAWMSYERARQQSEALRRHRGELSRALKDLDLAYRRLEAMAIELERARRAADEARRLKAEFAANISHELRTPLNLIIGFSEMMALAPHTYGEPLPPAYRGDVQAIYRNARHLSNLIDDVLDLSQIEAGRMGLAKEPISLSEVITEALGAIAHLFESKGLYLAMDIPSDLPTVPADRTRIRQVLINLLNNAARFTDQGGVTITATANKREVTVAIADTGIGIAEEDIPKVFEEFRQLDGSIRRRAAGSGLGLAISKKFVELHGGRMWVKSKPGVGTTFYFSLPLREDLGISRLPPEWETWAHLPPDKEGQKTIVVVDPEPATAKLFERYLDGYRVVHAADEDEARQLAARELFHALIVIAPSGETGWLQLRQAREGLPNVPVVVCTLRGGTIATKPDGVATYLVKPVSREHFLAALEKLGPDVHSLLIVDDAPEVVQLLSRMVQMAPRPYRVWKAYSGVQALEILREHQPDAVVLDLLMPEVDGYTVLEHMRSDERLREIPVIVVTAKGQDEEVITAGLVGITRREGMSVGELMRCLKASLDALRSPALIHTVPVPSAASVE